MYNNIGVKIKVLARIIAWIGIIGSIITGWNLSVEYSGYYGAEDKVAIGLSVFLGGPLLSWISSCFIYGFGELIEKTTEIANYTYGLSGPREPSDSPTSGPSGPSDSPTSEPRGPSDSPTSGPRGPSDSPTSGPRGPSDSPSSEPREPSDSPTSGSSVGSFTSKMENEEKNENIDLLERKQFDFWRRI